MTNKYHTDVIPVTSYFYAPAFGDTGDLEAATKVISAVAEASGLVNADYVSGNITQAMPTDARLVLDSFISRLTLTTDAFTCTHLYCRVYVDSQVAANLLFDLDITSGPASSAAVSAVAASVLPAIYALFSDGLAHKFYFFFWVNANAATLSLVQLVKTFGCVGTGGSGTQFAHINYSGLMALAMYHQKYGVGNTYMLVGSSAAYGSIYSVCWTISNYSSGSFLANPVVDNPIFKYVNFGTQTDMAYITALALIFYN